MLQTSRIERTHVKIDFIKKFYQAPDSPSNVILILGDSTVAFGVKPSYLPKSISLAIPGATMLTVKEELQRYLKVKNKPSCLLLSTASINEYYESYFWKIYISSEMYNSKEIVDIYQDSHERNLFPSNQYSNFYYNLKSFFFKHVYFSAEKKYKLSSFIGLDDERSRFYEIQTRQIAQNKGYILNSPSLKKNTLITERNTYLFSPFEKNESDNQYLEQILKITSDQNIKVFYLEMPILFRNDSKVMDFHRKHMANISAILSKYKNSTLLASPALTQEGLYHDISHLNAKGADELTKSIAMSLKGKCGGI